MTAIVHGSFQGSVVIEDEDGQGAIPLSLLRRARTLAVNNDRHYAAVYGRQYSTEALILADNTADELGLVELPPCNRCVDRAAIAADHKDRPVCFDCIPVEG